jgi:hypothetical protein
MTSKDFPFNAIRIRFPNQAEQQTWSAIIKMEVHGLVYYNRL